MRAAGFTLLEMLVTLAVLAVLLGISALGLRGLDVPAANAARALEGTLTQARARALATTSAVRLVAASPGRIVGQRARSCASPEAEWGAEPALTLELPAGASVGIIPADWPICYSSRGLTDRGRTLSLTGPRGGRRVQVLLGGAVRTLP